MLMKYLNQTCVTEFLLKSHINYLLYYSLDSAEILEHSGFIDLLLLFYDCWHVLWFITDLKYDSIFVQLNTHLDFFHIFALSMLCVSSCITILFSALIFLLLEEFL